jgi:hypothetical protein
VLGAIVQMYFDGAEVQQWAPGVVALTDRTLARAEPDEEDHWNGAALHETGLVLVDGWDEAPAAWHGPGEELRALIHARQAWDLAYDYFFALSARLAAAWGVPVAVEEIDGLTAGASEQIRDQLDARTAADWEARGLLPRRRP